MRDPTRWIVLAIVLLALGVRVAFVLTVPDRPLYWDEPLYHDWGKLYQYAWPASVGGAQGVTLRDAFRTSLQKGEAYAATVGLVYACWGAQPRAVFVLQALLDTLTCLLLYGLARALGGVRAGLIALTLAALYEPFIFSAARLQTETLASLLCVGALWAISVPEQRRTLGHFCAGMLTAATMLTRPALQFLFPVLLPMILVRNADRAWRGRCALALIFATGFFVVEGPRLVLTKVLTGEAVWSGTLDPSIDMYAGAIVGNAGWKTDRLSFTNPPLDELLAVVGNDPHRKLEQADFRAATLRTWALHPFDSATVMLHKLYVAWLYPYNDSRWTLLAGATVPVVWHRIVLLLGLVGMPLALQRRRIGVPLIAATLYLWLSYLVVKIEVRYAVVAMPTMICFAGLAVACVSTGWQRAWRAGGRRRLAVLAAGAAAGLVAASTLTIARLLALLPVAPETAHGVRVGVILAVMGWLAYATAELTGHLWRRQRALAVLAPAGAVAALVALFGPPVAQTWREWQCVLTPHHGVAGQAFDLPNSLQRPLSARLKLDLLPAGEGGYDLVLRINGDELKRYRGGLTRSDADLPAEDYFQRIVVARRRELEPDKAWYTVEVPLERISPGARLAVEVALEGEGAPDASVAIFGDYSPNPSTYVGPSLLSPALTADTSLYKYLVEEDFRMRRQVPVSGISHSRFYDGSRWSETDLGFAPGRQQGRYRIFLLLEYESGTAVL